MKKEKKEQKGMKHSVEVKTKDNQEITIQEENATLSSDRKDAKENKLNNVSEVKVEETVVDANKQDISSQIEEQEKLEEKVNTNNESEMQETTQEQTAKEEENNTENKIGPEEEKKKTVDQKQSTEKETMQINNKEQQPQSSKKSKKTLPIIITVAVILFIAMFFSIIFALLNMNNNKIIEGISVLGIDVSNLTVEDATNKINTAIQERFSDENNTLILKRGDEETSVTANTFNATFDVDASIAEAYNIGRDGNIVTNNYAILWTKMTKKDIQPTLYLDEELLNSTIKDVSSKMKDRVVENSYYVEDDELIIVR